MNEPDPARTWLGTGWSFPPDFNRRSRGVTMVGEEEDIWQSLWILLSTVPGERIMNPAYGCGLKLLTFEQINDSTFTEIRDVIDRAVLFFEPRIRVDTIDIEVKDFYRGEIRIQLNYTIRITNNRANMVYPFYFQEATGPE